MTYTGNNWYTKRDSTGSPPKLYKTEFDNIVDHMGVKSASYVVRKNGSYYEAIHGDTSKIVYGGEDDEGSTVGTDKAAVQQACVTALSSGGTIFLKENTLDDSVTYGSDILIIEDYQGTRKYYNNGSAIFTVGGGSSVDGDTATISAGDTTVVVDHNIGATPYVTITPQSNIGGRNVWVNTKTATQFTIHIDSADPFNDLVFEYIAVP